MTMAISWRPGFHIDGIGSGTMKAESIESPSLGKGGGLRLGTRPSSVVSAFESAPMYRIRSKSR